MAAHHKKKPSQRLFGENILYKFEEDEGGWAWGTISARLSDAEDTETVEVDGEDEERPRNFAVEYDDGLFNHCLTAEGYATSHDDEPGTWVILKRKGKGKGKAKVPAAASAPSEIPDVSAMSPGMRAALRAALAAASPAGGPRG